MNGEQVVSRTQELWAGKVLLGLRTGTHHVGNFGDQASCHLEQVLLVHRQPAKDLQTVLHMPARLKSTSLYYEWS